MKKRHETPICPSNVNLVKNFIESANVIFEIGAHDGVDIDNINALWDNPIIHCFEPDPEPFEDLKEYISDKVICNNIGLFDKEGTATLYKVFNKALNSNDPEVQKNRDLWFRTIQSLYPINKDFRLYGNRDSLEIFPIEVQVTTLDIYCENNKVIPNIILMDTQGSEYDILKGASKILENRELKAIMLEWSKEELYKNQKGFYEIHGYLSEFGFELKETINLWEDIHGDAIFIRN